jgi:hypothetical protein
MRQQACTEPGIGDAIDRAHLCHRTPEETIETLMVIR